VLNLAPGTLATWTSDAALAARLGHRSARPDRTQEAAGGATGRGNTAATVGTRCDGSWAARDV